MLTKELTLIEKVNRTKRELRQKDLSSGEPFMCFEEHLPSNEAIYEYPNGRFEVVQITGVQSPAKFVRLATPSEIKNIRMTNPAYAE